MSKLFSFLIVFLHTSFVLSQIITKTAISPKEDFIVAGTSEGEIYIIDIISPTISYNNKHVGAVTDIDPAPQKDEFLSVGLGGNLYRWNISGNIIIQRPKHINERLFSLAITPGEAEYFLYGGSEGKIYFCDYDSFKLLDIYTTKQKAIYEICYSQHYNDEFIICYYDGSIEKRDVVSKNDVIISSTKRHVVTEILYMLDNSNYVIGFENGVIEVYNEFSNERIKRFSEFSSPITSLDVTDGNSYLLAGSEDSTVILLDLDLQKKLYVLPKHIGRVVGSYFLENQNLIITVTDNQQIYFWDRGSLSQIGYLLFNKTSICYFFSGNYELFGKQDYLQMFPVMNDLAKYEESIGLYKQMLNFSK